MVVICMATDHQHEASKALLIAFQLLLICPQIPCWRACSESSRGVPATLQQCTADKCYPAAIAADWKVLGQVDWLRLLVAGLHCDRVRLVAC